MKLINFTPPDMHHNDATITVEVTPLLGLGRPQEITYWGSVTVWHDSRDGRRPGSKTEQYLSMIYAREMRKIELNQKRKETIKGPTIRLWSGHYFHFLDPDNSAYTIDDIAHGLSMVCRFGGHCAWHYSVAQHSVYVSERVPPEYAYAGLMHDAPEAVIGDVMKPLKMLLPDYQRIERDIETSIFKRFLVPNPLPAPVKDADWRMLITEQRQLAHCRDDWDTTQGREPYEDLTIRMWTPAEAKRAFLKRFQELSPLRFAT